MYEPLTVPDRLPSLARALMMALGAGKRPPWRIGRRNVRTLLPLLLREMSLDDVARLTADLPRATLAASYCRDVLTALGLSAELKGLFHALAAAHVCPLLLKGSDLAFTVYPDPLLRPAADVDLLVRPGDLARALVVLEARGYRRTDEYRTAAEAPHRDSFTYCRGTPVGDLHVEMHVGLHRSNGRIVFPAEDIWARARPLDVLGARVYGMEPGDLLLYLPWHARTHAFRRIAWLYDVALVAQAFGSSLDWDDVARRAHHYGVATPLYYVLTWNATLFDTTAPPAFMAAIRPMPLVRLLAERVALRRGLAVLVDVAHGDERRVLQSLMVDSVAALVHRWLRVLVPSRQTLKQRYLDRARRPRTGVGNTPLLEPAVYRVLHVAILLLRLARFFRRLVAARSH